MNALICQSATRKSALIVFNVSLALCLGMQAQAVVENEPATPLANGFQYLTDFKSAKAIQCFSTVLLNSKNGLSSAKERHRLSIVYALIGRAFSFDENDEAAIQSFYIAARLDEKNYVAKAYLADILDRIGRTDDANVLFKQLESLPDDNPAIEVVKAGRLGRQLELKKAEVYLKHCIATTHSGAISALYAVLARTMLREGFSKDASNTLLTASKKCNSPYIEKTLEAFSAQCDQKNADAERLYREAGRIKPDDPSWMTGVAGALERAGKKPEGLQWRAKSIECSRTSSFALSQYAFALNAMKRKKDGLLCLEHIALVRPAWPEIYFLKGLFYNSDKDYKNAGECFKKNLELNTNSGISYAELAKVYEETGQSSLAQAAYREGAVRFPAFGQFWCGLGFMQLGASNWQAAKPLLEHAHSCYPSEDWPRMNIVFLNNVARIEAGIGICDYNSKQLPEATEMAKLFNQHKFVPELKGLLSLIHLRPGRLDFNDKSTQSANIHMALADMLLEFRDLNGAIKEAKQAVSEAPENVDFHSFLLYVLSENNQWVDAAQEDMSLSNQLVNQIPKRAQEEAKKIHF